MEFIKEKPQIEHDPSMPDFRFSEEEKEKMRVKMSDEDIDALENLVRQRLAKAQLEKEMKMAGNSEAIEEEKEAA